MAHCTVVCTDHVCDDEHWKRGCWRSVMQMGQGRALRTVNGCWQATPQRCCIDPWACGHFFLWALIGKDSWGAGGISY